MNMAQNSHIGLSTVTDASTENNSEAHVFDIPGYKDLSDTETVFSSYTEDDRDQFEFIEL